MSYVLVNCYIYMYNYYINIFNTQWNNGVIQKKKKTILIFTYILSQKICFVHMCTFDFDKYSIICYDHVVKT